MATWQPIRVWRVAPPVGGKPRPYVLTINGGSSSLKFALYPVAGPSEPIVSGRIERIGRGESRLVVSGIGGSGKDLTPSRPRTRPLPPGY